MSEDLSGSSQAAIREIRITRLNSDKTRKDVGSDTVYQVYFELSGHPPSGWRDIFGREWKGMKMTREAGIDGGFLVLHCSLGEVATTQLPALKKAVAATNAVYGQSILTEAMALEHREDVWREERKKVDAMANSLQFE